LTHQQGNVGEASKKAECWDAFRRKEIALGQDWEAELADCPFVPSRSEEEMLAVEWERLRHKFIQDLRTIEGWEAYTGKDWIRTRRNAPISQCAVLTWEQLRLRPGLGLKKIRALVEMFAIAAQE
jgi:hypothetical protein